MQGRMVVYSPVEDAYRKGAYLQDLYEALMSRRGMIESDILRIEKVSKISPYPPTIFLPQAFIHRESKLVIAGLVEMVEKDEKVYLEVQMSAPFIVNVDRKFLVGVLAHQLIHYVNLTLEIYWHRGEEEMAVGEVPDKKEGYTPTIGATSLFGESFILDAARYVDARAYRQTSVAEKIFRLVDEKKIGVKEHKPGQVSYFDRIDQLDTPSAKAVLNWARDMGIID